jgi:putative transposase
MSYIAFPKQHGKWIRTAQHDEAGHKELKQRARVVGGFPNAEVLPRVVGSVLMGINEEWVTGQKVFG